MRLGAVVLSIWIAGCGEGSPPVDPCASVVCEQVPEPECVDDLTLRSYAAGSCDADSGACSYPSSDRDCAVACLQARCVDERRAWGWVTVIEERGELHGLFGWDGGVRAFFSLEPCMARSLARHLRRFQQPLETRGACSLYQGYTWGQQDLAPEPVLWDLGPIEISGTSQPLALAGAGRYEAADPPSDLFGAGDEIRATAAGGLLGPIALQASGVAELALASDELHLRSGQPLRVEWTPAGDGSRVELALLEGYHYPHPNSAALLCDAPDEVGAIEVPADLVDAYIENAAGGEWPIDWPKQITRYTRDVQTPYGDEIELIVGTSRAIDLVYHY
ncbi:MAG: hypothetical protein JXR96_05830 [Deltaproteobacteria bacterium]|nr:hypothetical protein [Deltaproteobacteria bacterium]